MNDEIFVYDTAELNPWVRVVMHDDHLLYVKALQDEIDRLKSLLEFDLDECK